MKKENPQGLNHYFKQEMGYVPFGDTKAFKIMEVANAKSLSSIALDADTKNKVDELVAFMKNDQLMQQIGKLAVADALMGNSDRLTTMVDPNDKYSKSKTNIGNIMIGAKGQLTAIDSVTLLKEKKTQKELSMVAAELWPKGVGVSSQLMDVFGREDGPEQLTNLLIGAVKSQIEKVKAGNNFNPKAYYEEKMKGQQGNIQKQIQIGIKNGLAMAKNLLAGTTEQDKKNQKELRQASERRYGIYNAKDESKTSFASLEATFTYFESYSKARQNKAKHKEAKSAGNQAAYESLMASHGQDEHLRNLEAVDYSVVSLNFPKVVDKKATSARKSVRNNKIEKGDIEKWAEKYPSDVYVHALRLAQALADKRELIIKATGPVQILMKTKHQSQLSHTQLQAYIRVNDKLKKQIRNMQKQVNQVIKILKAADEKNKKKGADYKQFIDTLETREIKLVETHLQFDKLLNS